ncbi:MAG: acyl-CoA dehydrogenase family protein [Myxococcales bacterium]|jgi:alkylation response protein AidB-like acyl-CoA dehydrogenase
MTDTTHHASLDAVAELGPVFADRATALDREGRFAADNYRDMKAAKLLSAGVPRELGGGGAGHAQLCAMIRALARHCPSSALSLSMHTHLVAAAVYKHRHGQPGAALLKKVADGERVLVSTGAGDWVDSNGSSERVPGGYRVTATKRFGSGAPAGDIAVTSARYDDPEQGPMVLHFPVPLDAEGVAIADDWDTLGMRATGSQTIRYEGVFVPEEAIALKRPRGPWHPAWNVVLTVAVPIYTAAYVGLAEAAADEALQRARGQAEHGEPPAHAPYLVGELQNALMCAQLAGDALVENARDYDFEPELKRAERALRLKTLATSGVRATVDKAVELTGGAAYFRRCRLEQLWRDAQAAPFHPLPEKQQQRFTGRVALGLEPVHG